MLLKRCAATSLPILILLALLTFTAQAEPADGLEQPDLGSAHEEASEVADHAGADAQGDEPTAAEGDEEFVWPEDHADEIEEPSDHSQPYARQGFYLGVSMGGTQFVELEKDIKNEFDDIGLDASANADVGFAVNVRLGYRLTPLVALETQFSFAPNTDIKVKVDGLGSASFELETFTGTFNAKAYLLPGRFQPYALVGFGIMRAKISAPGVGSTKESDAVARLGGGFDYYITEHMVFNTELGGLLASRDLDGLSQFTFDAGIVFRF